MKQAMVKKLIPKPTRKSGYVTTTQIQNGILILNLYKDRHLHVRYCINIESGEYASVDAKGIWGSQKLENILDKDFPDWNRDMRFDTSEDKNRIEEVLEYQYAGSVWRKIDYTEDKFNRTRNERRYESKKNRIAREINSIPHLPDMDNWIYGLIGNNKDYAFWDKEAGKYCCTACGKAYVITERWKNNQKVICPECGKAIVVKKHAKRIHIPTQIMVVQSVKEDMTAIRFVDVRLEWNAGEKRYLNTSVAAVAMAYKKGNIRYRWYYNQETKREDFGDVYDTYYIRNGYWDSNSANRQITECYLYPDGIEALGGTVYERWARTFSQMAAGQYPFWYNHLLMSCYVSQNLVPMVEYLYKGRFYKLLQDVSGHVWPNMSWEQSAYRGELNADGESIEEVFGIEDKQIINRLRAMNGGIDEYRWLRFAYEEGWKLPQEVLEWLVQKKVEVRNVSFILGKMSLQQIMNYVKRQQEESYPGMSTYKVLSQWEDYLRICEILKKKTDDEMVYRPRELKRRHNEAVAERETRAAELIVDEYSEKYGEAESVLQEIKEKFEYAGNGFIIKVPDRIVDIVIEGRCLHHCIASSDRYLERIKNHETYICFLRKAAEPNTPYYTIEVEPGGTIRQHRGYLDEEPEFEQVKPFLQEWQRVIKSRMKSKDHELARISKEKREANTEDLIRRNNLKVLKGLEEDFMDAEAV